MWVQWRLIQVQHRRKAGVATFKQFTPLRPRAAQEQSRQTLLELRPDRRVHLLPEQWIIDTAALQQQGVEGRLQCADGDVLPVAAPVAAVEVGAAVEQIAAALIAPGTGCLETVEQRHQAGRAIGHGRIDDLSRAGGASLQQGSQHAHRQQHPPSPVVPHQIQRRLWRLAGSAHGVQGSGQGNVVDVMPCRLCQGSVLAPAGHAPIHQSRVSLLAYLRPQPQTFHYPRAETFQQAIGLSDHSQHQRHRLRLLEIHRQ